MKRLVVLSIALLSGISGCGSPSYYVSSEESLDTHGYFQMLDHVAAYYPSGVGFNFPGYIVGFEETSRSIIAPNREDVIVDQSVYASGITVKQLLKTLNYSVPFISQIMRYEGRPYGEGNCALYNLYHSEDATLINYCEEDPRAAAPANNDYALAFQKSWDAIDIMKEQLAREVASKKYTHLIVASMGLDTAQEEAIRNYTSIISSIRKNAGSSFKPLFVGITWPSFYANRWFDPIWEALAYSPVADRADVLGLSWLGVLLNEAVLPLGDQIEISVITHSFGARAASMALCVGPAILRHKGDPGNQIKIGKVENFIGLAPAFSLRRFIDKDYLFYENIYYADYCPAVNRVVFTASENDTAFGASFWSDAAGDYSYMVEFCKREQPVSVACVNATPQGKIKDYDPSVKLNYINTSSLMKYMMPGTKGAHSDIYRSEIGKLIWTILDGPDR